VADTSLPPADNTTREELQRDLRPSPASKDYSQSQTREYAGRVFPYRAVYKSHTVVHDHGVEPVIRYNRYTRAHRVFSLSFSFSPSVFPSLHVWGGYLYYDESTLFSPIICISSRFIYIYKYTHTHQTVASTTAASADDLPTYCCRGTYEPGRRRRRRRVTHSHTERSALISPA